MICDANKSDIPLAAALENDSRLASRKVLRPFVCYMAILALLFAKPLFDLARYALQESFYSHIFVIPFISIYLLRQKISFPITPGAASPLLGAGLIAVGLVSLGITAAGYFSLGHLSLNDYLSGTIFSFVCFTLAGYALFLGKSFFRDACFALLFLFFLTPFPEAVTRVLEVYSQHASAEVYSWLMTMSRATYFRQGQVFILPELTIRVAQECSGIRSSFVLFITSLMAGFLFLKSPWHRAIFSVIVIPLGIFRNAFRIYFLSMASAHWDPRIIDSPLHHRGGPIFFVLSLIPLFLLLFWFRKREAKTELPPV
jgi:exosortase C (VPDSG-CTERM-specific)